MIIIRETVYFQTYISVLKNHKFAPKPVVLLAPQSPIPVGPVAAKVAEAFGDILLQ